MFGIKGLLLSVLLIAGFVSAFVYSSGISGYSPAAVATPTPVAESISRPTSAPYTGSLDIFEDPERDKKLQVERVMDVLGIAAGKNVADIGAGSGWFTVRAAKRVGAKGRVYAVEINQDYIRHIDDRAKKEGFANIQTVLGKPENPMLPERSVDAVLILKTYHEIAEPVKLMTFLRKSLRRGALVGVIDRNGNGEDHGVGRETIIEEAGRAGYKLKEEFDFVKGDGMDYFLVFREK